MARGWESKSVESQIEDAARDVERGPSLSKEEQELRSRRSSLELSRQRVASQLASATAPAHRTALEHALEHLDAEIARLV